MSSQRTHFSTWEEERIHRERRIKKLERIQTLKALIEMWEPKLEPDAVYLIELRHRLYHAQKQYDAMKP